MRWALILVMALFGAVITGAPARADETFKVVVIPAGQRVTLESVAAATLGDPGRAGEILELNRGRRQPGGGALNAAGDTLRPGWILRLPDDASGPAVQVARETGGLTLPLPAVLAIGGALLLALITVAIVARRPFARLLRLAGAGVHRLGEPARRRRRLAYRMEIGRRFAAGTAVPDQDPFAFPVRVGEDPEGTPVVVDLSRLDGVLAVTGDPAVAAQVVRNLVTEARRSRPGLPVTALPGPAVPPPARPGTTGPVHAAALRQPVRGLVVLTTAPTPEESAAVVALCGSAGAGWTGLVTGDPGVGTHWRWHVTADGTVDLPVQGLTAVAPA